MSDAAVKLFRGTENIYPLPHAFVIGGDLAYEVYILTLYTHLLSSKTPLLTLTFLSPSRMPSPPVIAASTNGSPNLLVVLNTEGS